MAEHHQQPDLSTADITEKLKRIELNPKEKWS
jgi:hypothetical protein